MNEEQLIKNLGGERETLIAACKLITKILFNTAKKANATNITFSIGDITEIATNQSWGNIKIDWSLND